MTTTATTRIKQNEKKAEKVPLGATVNIPPRRLDFEFDETTPPMPLAEVDGF